METSTTCLLCPLHSYPRGITPSNILEDSCCHSWTTVRSLHKSWVSGFGFCLPPNPGSILLTSPAQGAPPPRRFPDSLAARLCILQDLVYRSVGPGHSSIKQHTFFKKAHSRSSFSTWKRYDFELCVSATQESRNYPSYLKHKEFNINNYLNRW